MNYIKKLESENKDLQDEVLRMEMVVQELRIYLDLPKFQCDNELDGYVNIKDVLARLSSIRHTSMRNKVCCNCHATYHYSINHTCEDIGSTRGLTCAIR